MKRTVFRIFLLLMLVLALGLILMLALRGGEAEEPTLTSPALTALLNRLRDGVQPGTAGSSLKAAGAAADLLDWAEDPIPQENIDATVICERPKLRPFVELIRSSLAELMGIGIGRISVKGKTNEGMDAVGAGKGIVVHAVALLK